MNDRHNRPGRDERDFARDLDAIRKVVDEIKAETHAISHTLPDAFEKSQTALLNAMSLLSAKIDNLGTGSTPAEVAAITAELHELRERLAASVAGTPTPNTTP